MSRRSASSASAKPARPLRRSCATRRRRSPPRIFCSTATATSRPLRRRSTCAARRRPPMRCGTPIPSCRHRLRLRATKRRNRSSRISRRAVARHHGLAERQQETASFSAAPRLCRCRGDRADQPARHRTPLLLTGPACRRRRSHPRRARHARDRGRRGRRRRGRHQDGAQRDDQRNRGADAGVLLGRRAHRRGRARSPPR